MSIFFWHIMSSLSRLVPMFPLWNILPHHLGNILVYLTRFIPTFTLYTSLHCIEGTSLPWIPLQTWLFTRLHFLTSSEEHYGTIWHSLTFSLEPTLLETVLYILFRNLSTFPDLLNFVLVISPDVELILMGDLLHGLLCDIVLLLGVIIGLVPQQDLTQIAVHCLQLILLYCATAQSCSWVLERFILYPVLYSFSSWLVYLLL